MNSSPKCINNIQKSMRMISGNLYTAITKSMNLKIVKVKRSTKEDQQLVYSKTLVKMQAVNYGSRSKTKLLRENR